MSYLPGSGSVAFPNGASSAALSVDIESNVFLALNSTFTVVLTLARYIGDEGKIFKRAYQKAAVCNYIFC